MRVYCYCPETGVYQGEDFLDGCRLEPAEGVTRIAPPQYATEAFTWSTSCLLSGVGLGLAAGGLLLEQANSAAVFGTAGAVSVGAAVLAYASLRRA